MTTLPSITLPNRVRLEYEVHGERSNPVIFPILGITDNITDWPPGLYEPFVEAGYCVVRHELRDSGLSSKFDVAGAPDLAAANALLGSGQLPDSHYTMHDVAADALALLDALNIQSACVIGYSYGAAVAQLLALRAPQRVTQLVCLQGSNYDPALPSRTAAVNQAMSAATVEYSTRDDSVRAMQALRMATNGSVHQMDETEARHSAQRSVERMYYPVGTARIVLSRLATAPFFEDIRNIACPSLVLHGDEDPIFPLAHGEAIAQRLPHAKLKVLKGAGHNHPASLQPVITESILRFLKECSQLE